MARKVIEISAVQSAPGGPAGPAATANPLPLYQQVRLVSLVVVARNERRYLPNLLADINNQDFPHQAMEVILVDSNNGRNPLQRQAMVNFQQKAAGFSRVLILDNPKKTLPAGCNRALAAFYGDVFLRLDGHARIPTDFVRRVVEGMEEGHEVCGGSRSMILFKSKPWTRTLQAAEISRFGAGASAYRHQQKAGPVQSLFHGAYRRRVLDRVGKYDERLQRTEDNDYSQRVRAAGFEIWFDPRIHSEQLIRPTLGSLLRQKMNNGLWVGRTLWMKPQAISPLLLVPLIFLLALIAGLVLGFTISWWPLLLLIWLYLTADLIATILAMLQMRRPPWQAVALLGIFPLLHLSYGLGTLGGLFRGKAR